MSSEVPNSPWQSKEERRESIGLGFDLGLTFGTAYNFTKGFISSSSSSSSSSSPIKTRLMSGLRCARSRCIPTCGIVAGMFLVGDSVGKGLKYYRRKDDSLNTFVCFAASALVVGAVNGVNRGPLFCACAVFGYGTFGAVTDYHMEKYIDMKTKEKEQLRKRNNLTDETQ